jgi:bifunctional DNA-binding transcriptional regulator/antitoxin component of YhaV-PrlF toxin-antitoxin module
MPRSYEAKVQRVVSRSESLRVTVPQVIVALLDLKDGDTLAFTVEPGSGKVSVTKKEGPTSQRR